MEGQEDQVINMDIPQINESEEKMNSHVGIKEKISLKKNTPKKPKKPTNILTKYRATFKKKKSQLENINKNIDEVKTLKIDRSNFLRDLQGIVDGTNVKTTSWLSGLKECKDRIITSKTVGNKSPDEVIELIRKADEKMYTLSKLVNNVTRYIQHEQKKIAKQLDEADKLKTSVGQFVGETLEEMNKMTTIIRQDVSLVNQTKEGSEFTEPNDGLEFFIKNDSSDIYGLAENRKPRELVTSLFRLYDHDKDTKPEDLFKKKKKKAK